MNLDAKIDKIFDRVDDWLLAGEFEKVDDELHGINVNETSTDLLVAYLSITLMASDKLKYRPRFYENVKNEFQSRYETKYRWERLLVGLD